MGSIFYVPIIYDNDLSFLMNLKSEGFSLVATSLEESKNFFDEDLSGKVILSVGNEGNGISNEIFDLADKKVNSNAWGSRVFKCWCCYINYIV